MSVLLVDITNLAFAIRFAKIKTPANRRHKEKLVKEVVARETISWILTHAQKFGCTGLVIAGDGKSVWRREVFPEYKGNRTTDEDVYYEDVLAAIDLMCEWFTDHTSAYVINVHRCEADDVIAYWTQNTTQECVILSTDKDFIQLVRDGVRLYSPVQKVFRETEDAQFDLFLKCIRGDKSDNVRSAYPRIRETKVREAWEDDYELLNLLETTLKDGSIVGEIFEMNQKLIDLTMQPDWVKSSIDVAVKSYTPSKYRELSSMKWWHDNNLGQSGSIVNFKEGCLKAPPEIW